MFVHRAITSMDDGIHELLSYGLVHPFVFTFQMLRSEEVCNQMLFEGLIHAEHGNIGIN